MARRREADEGTQLHSVCSVFVSLPALRLLLLCLPLAFLFLWVLLTTAGRRHAHHLTEPGFCSSSFVPVFCLLLFLNVSSSFALACLCPTLYPPYVEI